MSRENILAAVKANQLKGEGRIDITEFESEEIDVVAKFIEVLQSIGGQAYKVDSFSEMEEILNRSGLKDSKWILSLSKDINIGESYISDQDPHSFEQLDLLLIESSLGVAENGSVWISETDVNERVLPFITQHLAVVVRKESIVANMHHAYAIISKRDYGFATFIAGPSKTADIEQSLVLGAHGPKTMTVFIL